MKTGSIGKALCLFCLSLPVAGTVLAAAQSGTPSILSRVQREEDPELGELIRVALANRQDINEKEALEVVRKVTQSYARIRLLDRQIEQIAQRAGATAGPAEMRHELLLAGAELESKRLTELATLREAMGVIPLHAFGKKPLPILHAWVRLHVLGQRVYVLDTQKPFDEYWATWRFQPAGLLSEGETWDYVRGRLRDKNSLPMRIDVLYTAVMSGTAGALRDRIVALARETNSQMEIDVRLEPITWVGSGESTFFLREGKIGTLHGFPVQRPDGGSRPLVMGLVEPNDLEQHILWRLTYPGNLPLTLRIEYDEASTELAKWTADMAKAVVKRLGIAELVEVAEELVEPIPEAAFLGRWQVLGKGEIQRIDVRPGAVCLLMMGGGSESTQAGRAVTCPWVSTLREIIMDSKEHTMVGPHRFVFRGYLNANGNLIVEKGQIYPQGSFHRSGDSSMIFTKLR